MEEKILNYLGRSEYRPSTSEQLFQLLRLKPAQKSRFQQTLQQLLRSGAVIRTKGLRWILSKEADLVAGTLLVNRQGKGFLQPEDGVSGEILIPESATSTALHGDRVLVRKDVSESPFQKRNVGEATGVVVRILERKRTQLVGTFAQSRTGCYVVPDDPRIPYSFWVPPPKDLGRPVHEGDKVLVEFSQWESRNTQPEGVIVEALGSPDAEGVDMLSVLRNFDLPLRFPRTVLEEAEQLERHQRQAPPAARTEHGRVDCRHHAVITIDPDDAKDFDDAIYLEPAPQQRWKLWVHIADVSHYVREGSALDAEARKRGNSTYLVDRVIPMLPEILSNELCSLKPMVDRLTKCVEFLLDAEGTVLRTQFYSAVIHSKRRYTYQEVSAILGRPPEDDLERLLHETHTVAQKIRRTRFRQGSLDLDFPEMKIRLDAQGKVSRIERSENDASHQLIEECMLLANEAVAARLMELKRPALYRVHEPPKESKLREYRGEVLRHGIQCGNLNHREEIPRLLHRLSATPVGSVLKVGLLRSLMRARYAAEPLGHFGLNKAKYTHFTSPIRRYADLVVHRALFDSVPPSLGAVRQVGTHLSETERNSADAERASKDVKLYAYLNAQLNSGQRETYSGWVIEVKNFGFFVDVTDLGMSGLVPLSSIPDEVFFLDAQRLQLIGRRTRRCIRPGDRVKVRVFRVDTAKRQVDFEWIPEGASQSPSKTRETVRPRSFQAPRESREARILPAAGGRSPLRVGFKSSGRPERPASRRSKWRPRHRRR